MKRVRMRQSRISTTKQLQSDSHPGPVKIDECVIGRGTFRGSRSWKRVFALLTGQSLLIFHSVVLEFACFGEDLGESVCEPVEAGTAC